VVRRDLLEAVALVALALGVRLVAATALGRGAPFGPDGTGAEAAVVLGGHLYGLHVWLIRLFGSARALSIAAGVASCLLLWGIGRRTGLGGGGGWLAATLPLAVYTSVLSAGDAPALALVLVGVWLACRGRLGGIVGGGAAAASVAIKPVALPAALLLLAWPWAAAGFGGALVPLSRWLQPLLAPRPHSGLLGSWWQASGGAPPTDPAGWLDLVDNGGRALLGAPAWTLAPLLVLGVAVAFLPGQRRARLAAIAPLLAGLAIAAAFGERLEPRYLASAVVIALPFVGRMLPRGLLPVAVVALLWPTAAVITQVAAERGQRDPLAGVAPWPVVELPAVDAAALFDESSTDGATALRNMAFELAGSLPPGGTVTVRRRPHGREGELVWPLLTLRPDVRVERVDGDDPAGL